MPEKKGLVAVAAVVPLKPASQAQSPAGTLVPAESPGQLVVAQVLEKNGLVAVGATAPGLDVQLRGTQLDRAPASDPA